jgi:hypothetical protein
MSPVFAAQVGLRRAIETKHLDANAERTHLDCIWLQTERRCLRRRAEPPFSQLENGSCGKLHAAVLGMLCDDLTRIGYRFGLLLFSLFDIVRILREGL